MVFYRKYRPQKIADLDSEIVRNSLYSIFAKADLVPHAFLFSGPKGLGKTSAARIVAKVINCEKHQHIKGKKTEKEIEPCNKCLQCTSITSGTNFDVLEIDGASNRGIDEIRDLKEKINLLPSLASKKIYIIDEVHMLTTEAFNALLKTLEEPPKHVIFILCTTELHKVPQTIVSRCFRVDFKKASYEEIFSALKRIIKSEEIKIDNLALLEIAKMSDGSFRDSTKILEELALEYGKKNITQKLIEEKYNILGIEKSIEEIIEVLQNKDTKKGFEITARLAGQGMDFKFFIEKLMDKFHLMLLTKLGVLTDIESKFSVLEIKNLLELLAGAYQETKTAVLPQLPLELALIEWSESMTTLDNNLTQAEEPKLQSITKTTITNNFYQDFVNEVKNHNHLLAGVLRSCDIEEVKGKTLEIFAISKFHKEKLEEEESMLLLEEVGEKLAGKKVSISIILRG